MKSEFMTTIPLRKYHGKVHIQYEGNKTWCQSEIPDDAVHDTGLIGQVTCEKCAGALLSTHRLYVESKRARLYLFAAILCCVSAILRLVMLILSSSNENLAWCVIFVVLGASNFYFYKDKKKDLEELEKFLNGTK